MIRLSTTAGAVAWRPLDGWSVTPAVVEVIDTYPSPHWQTPVGPRFPVDRLDERWTFLHALWALRRAGLAVTVVAGPRMVPPGRAGHVA